LRELRYHLLAALGIILGLVVGFAGIQYSLREFYTGQLLSSAVVEYRDQSDRVGQTFVADYGGLQRVQIRLAGNPGEGGRLTFHLRTSPEVSEDIVRLSASVEGDMWHTFQFPPVRDSAGRSFYFFLGAPASSEEGTLALWGAREDAYPQGEAVIQGAEGQARDLTFRLGYCLPPLERMKVAVGRFAGAKPSVWGDPRLYLVLALAYGALLYALLVGVLQWQQQKEE